MKRIAVLLTLLAVAAGTARAQVNGITAELELLQDQYLPDEDLQLRVKITNRSGQPLTFGQDTNWITFHIIGENNYLPPKTGEMPVVGEFTLPSGTSGERPFNPTPFYDLRRPGHYRIGATIKIPQWNQENQVIPCKSASFTVADGLPIHGLANIQFGVPPPPGVTNVAPEIRNYSLIKVAYLDALKLYFRLTDAYGRTLTVFPLSGMLSFSEPEAQLDRFNNFHVLTQTGARAFTYFVLTPDGHLVVRQTHDYGMRRPVLRTTDDGRIFVAGGQRRITEYDVPPPAAESARSQ
jgi:hypothetical protein